MCEVLSVGAQPEPSSQALLCCLSPPQAWGALSSPLVWVLGSQELTQGLPPSQGTNVLLGPHTHGFSSTPLLLAMAACPTRGLTYPGGCALTLQTQEGS